MSKANKAQPKKMPKDSFESVAKRLGANPDMKEFDAKMRKIAKAKPLKKSR
jgi:hypothetical protein